MGRRRSDDSLSGRTLRFPSLLPFLASPPDMSRSNFLRAFFASVLGTGLSRVLGLVRDIVISRWLDDAQGDAFVAAFTIPGLFRRFVADEGLTGALVPAVARAETEEDTATAQTLAGRVLSALLLLNAGLIALVMVVPDLFVWLSASGFDAEKFALTAEMTRWLMPFLLMVSLVSFFEGLLNHRGHFFVPKLAPGLVSAGIAIVVVFFSGWFPSPAWAVVAGVWVGGIVHVLVHLPLVATMFGPIRPAWNTADPRFRKVMRELGKVVAIGVFAQLNVLVLRTLASYMGDGAMFRYHNAVRMVDLAQGAIAVGIGSALLPNVSKAVAAEEWGRLRSDLAGAFRLAGFLLIPAAVGLFVYALPLSSLLFLSEKYGSEDVLWTASALQLLCPFMLALAGINIVKKVYFALDDRNLLLGVGAIGVGLTGLLGYLLLDQNILGLALALSIATVAQLVIYVGVLKVRLGENMPLGELAVPLGKMTAASIPVAIFAYWAASHGQWLAGRSASNLTWFGVGIGGSIVLYALSSWLLGLEELTRITGRLRARFGR